MIIVILGVVSKNYFQHFKETISFFSELFFIFPITSRNINHSGNNPVDNIDLYFNHFTLPSFNSPTNHVKKKKIFTYIFRLYVNLERIYFFRNKIKIFRREFENIYLTENKINNLLIMKAINE